MTMMTFGGLRTILMLFLPAAFLIMTEATRKNQFIRNDKKYLDERMKRENNLATKEQTLSHNDAAGFVNKYDHSDIPTRAPVSGLVDCTMTCSDDPLYELSCDYGTDFSCPFPFVSIPFLSELSCCESGGSQYNDIWGYDGRKCIVRGGYHVRGNEQFWFETESGDYDVTQLADENWCCPKKMLAPFINEFCHGPVNYAGDCGTLLDTPLVPVRLEFVAIDYDAFDHMPYYMFDMIPCYGESLIACCPTEEILDKVDEFSCSGSGQSVNDSENSEESASEGGGYGGGKKNGSNNREQGRRLFLKNSNEKHYDG